MTNLEKMRKKQAELHQQMQEIAQPPPKPPAVPVPPPETPAPQPPTDIVRKCGHAESVASIQSRDCTECKEKRRAKWGGGRLPPGPAGDGRLPHDAAFNVSYDAAAKQWSGALTVPTPEAETPAAVFNGTASGVFHLLRLLDKRWRAWVREQKVVDTPPAAE